MHREVRQAEYYGRRWLCKHFIALFCYIFVRNSPLWENGRACVLAVHKIRMNPNVICYKRAAGRHLQPQELAVLQTHLEAADLDPDKVWVVDVKTPFILAENEFDLNECSNTNEFIQCQSASGATFLGGCSYSIVLLAPGFYSGFIIQTNLEEGCVVFALT